MLLSTTSAPAPVQHCGAEHGPAASLSSSLSHPVGPAQSLPVKPVLGVTHAMPQLATTAHLRVVHRVRQQHPLQRELRLPRGQPHVGGKGARQVLRCERYLVMRCHNCPVAVRRLPAQSTVMVTLAVSVASASLGALAKSSLSGSAAGRWRMPGPAPPWIGSSWAPSALPAPPRRLPQTTVRRGTGAGCPVKTGEDVMLGCSHVNGRRLYC